MNDRYDNLLLKARAEMLGKHELRAEPSTDVVFDYVWDELQKGIFGSGKRGYKSTRRLPGRSGRLSDDAYSVYEQMRNPPPKQPRQPRQRRGNYPVLKPKPADQPPPDAPADTPDDGPPDTPTNLPVGPPGTPLPKDYDTVDIEATNEDVGAQADAAPWTDSFGQNTGDVVSPLESEGPQTQEPPSAFEQGWNVATLKPRTKDDLPVLTVDPEAPPTEAPPTEAPPPEESTLLAESGEWGGHADHITPGGRLRSQGSDEKPSKAFGRFTNWQGKQAKNQKVTDYLAENANEMEDNPDATVQAAQERKANRPSTPPSDNPQPDKLVSHDRAAHSAWSVLKDPFANPFYNPQAFDTLDDFSMSKNEDDPDSPDWKPFKDRSGGETPEEHRKRRLHEDSDDWRPGDKTGPVNEIPPEGLGDLAGTAFNPNWQQDNKSADTSLLPQGMLKAMQGQQQAEADYSLLPQGWQEDVSE